MERIKNCIIIVLEIMIVLEHTLCKWAGTYARPRGSTVFHIHVPHFELHETSVHSTLYCFLFSLSLQTRMSVLPVLRRAMPWPRVRTPLAHSHARVKLVTLAMACRSARTSTSACWACTVVLRWQHAPIPLQVSRAPVQLVMPMLAHLRALSALVRRRCRSCSSENISATNMLNIIAS